MATRASCLPVTLLFPIRAFLLSLLLGSCQRMLEREAETGESEGPVERERDRESRAVDGVDSDSEAQSQSVEPWRWDTETYKSC